MTPPSKEDIPLTEALRRLTGYGDYLYRQIEVNSNPVFLAKPGEGTLREVILLP